MTGDPNIYDFYRVEIECVYSWSDCIWVYRVYSISPPGVLVWEGSAEYRWSAKWEARRAVKKLKKGKKQSDGTRENPEVYYL